MNIAAPRPEHAAPTRGYHIASIGLDRLERILYERDELREREAQAGACSPCFAGLHQDCYRSAALEALDNGGEALGPAPLKVPSCTCSDCALGIHQAADAVVREGR
jgi:hypothetical protein